jgi:hypothetical protein
LPPLPLQAPAPPIVSVVGVPLGSVNVTVNLDASGGTPNYSYVIGWRTRILGDILGAQPIDSTTNRSVTVEINGFTPNTTYYFTTIISDSIGMRTESSPTSITIPIPIPLRLPVIAHALSSSVRSPGVYGIPGAWDEIDEQNWITQEGILARQYVAPPRSAIVDIKRDRTIPTIHILGIFTNIFYKVNSTEKVLYQYVTRPRPSIIYWTYDSDPTNTYYFKTHRQTFDIETGTLTDNGHISPHQRFDSITAGYLPEIEDTRARFRARFYPSGSRRHPRKSTRTTRKNRR